MKGWFRKGVSAYDQVATLEMILISNSRMRTYCWQAFLDIKKSLSHISTKACCGRGVRGCACLRVLLGLLKSLFNHTLAIICIGTKMSRNVIIGSKIFQGSLLSPIQFTIFLQKDTIPDMAGPIIFRRRNVNSQDQWSPTENVSHKWVTQYKTWLQVIPFLNARS